MNESDQGEIRAARVDRGVDFSGVITSLRMAGAEQYDPVRFHYLEVLANRATAHRGSVKRILDGKLAAALAAYRTGFEQAQNDAKDTIASMAAHYPHAADGLQRLYAAGDFGGVRRCIATLKNRDHRTSLGDLARYLAQQSPENDDVLLGGIAGSRAELKSVRHFRNTWSKLSVDRQLAQALDQAPENPGPLNSHMLVLRSLALMRDTSPDYLNRFMTYVDTLLCLDQSDRGKQLTGENGKKMKARRGRSR